MAKWSCFRQAVNQKGNRSRPLSVRRAITDTCLNFANTRLKGPLPEVTLTVSLYEYF